MEEDYTAAPWAPCTTPTVDVEDGTVTSRYANNQALFRRLSEAHAALRHAERREAEILVSNAQRIREATREKDQKIRELEEKNADLICELQQHQKREKTVEKRDERKRELHIMDISRDKLIINHDAKKLDASNSSLCSQDMKAFDVELLRRHDYYKGWLDAALAFAEEEQEAKDSRYAPRSRYSVLSRKDRLDKIDPRDPELVGAVAGELFQWAHLCQQNQSKWNACVDGRKFDLDSMGIPPRGFKDRPFWKGFDRGRLHAEDEFWVKMSRHVEHM